MDLILFNVSIIIYINYLVITNKRYLHMLQLNSYMNERYLTWYKINYSKELSFESILLLLPLFMLFYKNYLLFGITLIIISLILVMSFKKITEKKKFVITPRVKRLILTMSLLYLGILLIANYMYAFKILTPLLILITILMLFGELKIPFAMLANIINSPLEKSINYYYYSNAKKILQQNKNLKIIGITGSYGKTSSKYILSRILEAKYNVLMTPESYNTLMGVIRTIREHLKPMHEVFIVEMGAKKNKDIEEICKLVNPEYALLTSIGYQHLETFKSIDNVIKTKYELVDSVTKSGLAFLNFENKFISDKKSSGKYISYGINNSTLNYWAESIRFSNKGSEFVLNNYKNQPIELKTKLLGTHNILNITAACSIAMELNISPEEIYYAVKQIPAIPHRLELKDNGTGITIIDDAFNSNPEGAGEALKVLGRFDSSQRILITPGMVELGEKEYEFNFEFGKKAAQNCDYIILVGIKRSKPIKEGILNCGFSENKIFTAKNLNEALEEMKKIAKPGSVVLFENDLPDNYEE